VKVEGSGPIVSIRDRWRTTRPKLNREQAERLAAKAMREEKNLEGSAG
jgi:hypothetical protein